MMALASLLQEWNSHECVFSRHHTSQLRGSSDLSLVLLSLTCLWFWMLIWSLFYTYHSLILGDVCFFCHSSLKEKKNWVIFSHDLWLLPTFIIVPFISALCFLIGSMSSLFSEFQPLLQLSTQILSFFTFHILPESEMLYLSQPVI